MNSNSTWRRGGELDSNELTFGPWSTTSVVRCITGKHDRFSGSISGEGVSSGKGDDGGVV